MDSEFDKELNAEWIKINQKIQELNKERKAIFDKYRAQYPDKEVKIKWESTPSMYYDFFGNDIDKYKKIR